jgi:hypothetical protein
VEQQQQPKQLGSQQQQQQEQLGPQQQQHQEQLGSHKQLQQSGRQQMVEQLSRYPRQEGRQQQLQQRQERQQPQGQQLQQLQQIQQLQKGPEEQLLEDGLAPPDGEAEEEWEALCRETQEAASNTSNDLAWLLAGMFPFSLDIALEDSDKQEPLCLANPFASVLLEETDDWAPNEFSYNAELPPPPRT